MRRLDKEITQHEVIDEILNNSRVVRIAFSVGDIPYIVPVNFAHDKGKLFIHSAKEGSKINMIKENNLVCFEMELYDEIINAEKACNWTTKYRSIIGWGKISVSDDKDDKINGLDLIMKKYGSDEQGDYSEGMLNNMSMIIIEIEKLAGKQSGNWE